MNFAAMGNQIEKRLVVEALELLEDHRVLAMLNPKTEN
jgi:hypothetical protein